MISKKLILVLGILILSACGILDDIPEESINGQIMDSQAKMAVVRGATHVREIDSGRPGENDYVSFSSANVSIKDAIARPLSEYEIVPRDFGVDLSNKIDIRARHMSVADYLSVLSSLTGYEMTLEGDIINVRSFVNRTWNMAQFADARTGENISVSGQTSSSNNSAEITKTKITTSGEEDGWKELIKGAGKIIGASGGDGAGDSETPVEGGSSGPELSDFSELTDDELNMYKKLQAYNNANNKEAYIKGIRASGIIIAGGKPQDMEALDLYFDRALKASMSVFNIQVEAYEVALDHKIKKGVDWNIFKEGSINNANYSNLLESGSSEGIAESLWGLTGTYASGTSKVTQMISFLETFGRVTLNSQPNITVRNGVPAQVKKVEEFSFIADFEQVQSEIGQITVTPKFERINVGVTLSVTPRLLENDKIQVDILPIISSISGGDKFEVGDLSFEIPRVSLEELSTSLIADSGESIQLGGLISKKIINAVEGIPIRNRKDNTIASLLFDATNKEVERRELVMVVTPTLIESKY